MKQVVERLVTFVHWVLVVAGGGGCGNELIGWLKHHGASCGLFFRLYRQAIPSLGIMSVYIQQWRYSINV